MEIHYRTKSGTILLNGRYQRDTNVHNDHHKQINIEQRIVY